MSLRISDNGVDREMTASEQDEYHLASAQAAKELEKMLDMQQAAIAAKESAKAKLAALGLTEAEVNAIIGGV